MAKFCTNCGKKLKEGETCECKKETQISTSSVVSTLIDLVKGMFTKPVDTMKSFIDEANFNTALIALGVNAVAVAIFVAILCKELFASIFSLMGLGSSLSSFGGLDIAASIEIPYVKIILVSILTVAIVYAMIALIAYLISSKLFKNEANYKTMITWLGVTSTLLTVVILVAAVFSLISIKIGLVIYMAGSMLNTYYMYKGLSFACDTDENKLGYVLMPAILITTFVVSYILPKVIG